MTRNYTQRSRKRPVEALVDVNRDEEPPTKKVNGRGRPRSRITTITRPSSSSKGRGRGREINFQLAAYKKQEPDDQKEYEVEKILDMKNVGRGKKFLVKWKGYTELQSTWEPQVNLGSCGDLIKEFEEAKQKQNHHPSGMFSGAEPTKKTSQRHVDQKAI